MLKIVFIGDESVGKTSIINNCLYSTYKTEYTSTNGVNFFEQNYPNKSCNCQIWDASGQEQYRSMIPMYLRSCNTCLIFYDITNRQSFLNLDNWLNFAKENNSNIPSIIIIGNKNDLEDKREVPTEDAEAFAKSHNVHFLETSVKEETNFMEKIIDISLPIVESIQNSSEYIKKILRDSKKSLEKSKNELKKIKNALRETKKQPGENINSLKDAISLLTDAKNSLEDRKISLEKSDNPSQECIQSLEKSINSIQTTINSLQDSKVVLQNTVSAQNALNDKEEKQEKESLEDQQRLSQAEKVLSDAERKLSQGEKELSQGEKELSQGEKELSQGEKVSLHNEEELVHEKEPSQDENDQIQEEEDLSQGERDIIQEEEEEPSQNEEEELLQNENEPEKDLIEEEKELSLDEIDLSVDDGEKKLSTEERKNLEDKIQLYIKTAKISRATKDDSREMDAFIDTILTKIKEHKEKLLDYLPQIRCLMLGLDSSGKTTILYRLKRNKFVKTNQTTGFNVEPILHNENIFNVWDIAGQNRFRESWKFYYENTRVLIFVVDSTNLERIDEARKELHKLLNEKELKQTVLLVLANKKDLQEATNIEELSNHLELNKITDRKWHIQATSAMSGEGLLDGINWIGEVLELKMPENNSKPKTNNSLPKNVATKLIDTICSLENKENSIDVKIDILKLYIHSLEHRSKSLSSSTSTSPASPRRTSYIENIEVLIKFFRKLLFVFESKTSK